MAKSRAFSMWLIGLFLLLAYATLLPRAASADTCIGNIEINYVPPPPPAVPGNTVHVVLTLFTGPVDGGTQVTWQRVRFDLDCDVASPGMPCIDDGNVVKYLNNLTSGPNCKDSGGIPVTFSASSNSGDFTPNEVVFTPSQPFVLNANTPNASGCTLEFDVQVASYSNDATPNTIEELAGFRTVIVGGVPVPDATCDNGLTSATANSGAINMAPPTCGNGVLDPGETCDPPGSVQGNGNVCRSDCTYCGDSILNGTETCDPGATPGCTGGLLCRSDCARCLKNDPATIRFRSTGNDRLWGHGRFEADHSIDPATEPVGIRLTNTNTGAVLFEKELAAGSMIKKPGTSGRTLYRYENPDAKADGGIRTFKITHGGHWYRVTAEAFGDLSLATDPFMTIEVYIGGEEYKNSGKWRATGHSGWLIQK